MGPKAKKKLEELKKTLPDAEESDRTKLKDLLGQVKPLMDVVHDLCIVKDKETKEQFIQMMLLEANRIVEAAKTIAKEDKITFSFLGMDIQYLGGNEDQPTLVHPDTERVMELEKERDSGDWDGSSASCPGY